MDSCVLLLLEVIHKVGDPVEDGVFIPNDASLGILHVFVEVSFAELIIPPVFKFDKWSPVVPKMLNKSKNFDKIL